MISSRHAADKRRTNYHNITLFVDLTT